MFRVAGQVKLVVGGFNSFCPGFHMGIWCRGGRGATGPHIGTRGCHQQPPPPHFPPWMDPREDINNNNSWPNPHISQVESAATFGDVLESLLLSTISLPASLKSEYTHLCASSPCTNTMVRASPRPLTFGNHALPPKVLELAIRPCKTGFLRSHGPPLYICPFILAGDDAG